MKKSILLLLAFAIVALPACQNNNKKKSAEEEAAKKEISVKEQLATEDLKINIANLQESLSKMKTVPFIGAKGGNVSVSDKEKMVKPDYLADPAFINDLVTLTQKYRAAAVLTVDRAVADLYDANVTSYDEALAKLNVDINDAALEEFTNDLKISSKAGETISTFCDREYEAQRAPLFWEALAASLVEQVYVCTQNIDKFITMFDDEAASDITYNFITVHEGIKSLIEFYPEMESLNTILDPLYVINAINVQQLRDQLTELKGEIVVVRTLLTK